MLLSVPLIFINVFVEFTRGLYCSRPVVHLNVLLIVSFRCLNVGISFSHDEVVARPGRATRINSLYQK